MISLKSLKELMITQSAYKWKGEWDDESEEWEWESESEYLNKLKRQPTYESKRQESLL